MYDGVDFLWNHNQALLPTEYAQLDFRELPTDPDTDRQKHNWETYLDLNKYNVVLPSGDMQDPSLSGTMKRYGLSTVSTIVTF